MTRQAPTVCNAATTAAARSAVRSLRGEFSKEINRLLGNLIELRALEEATLDFPDEEVDFLEAAPENWIGVGGRFGKHLSALAAR